MNENCKIWLTPTGSKKTLSDKATETKMEIKPNCGTVYDYADKARGAYVKKVLSFIEIKTSDLKIVVNRETEHQSLLTRRPPISQAKRTISIVY